MPDENTKTCFVIAPIDDPDTPTRKWSDQVLRHIIRPAVEPLGYKAIRADEIDKPGIITTQVLNQVVESELVIADLTERNPNVFYELAIRHAISKPFVQIIKKSEQLPFDVAQNRTVFVDLQDPDNVADSVKQITSQIESLESDPEDVDNPISVSINLQRLLQSPDPEQRSLADVLSALSEIQGRISNYGDVSSKFDSVLHAIQEQPLIGSRRERSIPLQLTLRIARGSDSPFGFLVLLSSLRGTAPWLFEVGLEAQRMVVAGNTDKARDIFQELIRLLEISSGVLPRSPVSMNIVGDLEALFERMVQYFGYTGAPSDADELPW